MKLSYHKYYIQNGNNRHLQNLLPLLEQFIAIDSKPFKNSFISLGGDHLFLFQLLPQIFLFIVTKDNEIIKSVNSDTFSHQDIHDKLSADENIGFASYVYFSNNFYGIASTFYGPKNIIFNNFINDIFKKINLDSYCFESMPFPVEATGNTVLNLDFKGSVRFDVTRENALFDEIVKFFGEPQDTNKISIQFKPEPRQQMSDTFNNIMDQLEDDGLQNFIARGKETLQDSITDFYISGTGHIHDFIKVKGEMEICQSIRGKIGSNTLLANGIEEYTNDQTYNHNNIQAIADYNNLDHWNNYIQNSPYAG